MEDIKSVLIDRNNIRERIKSLAKIINVDYLDSYLTVIIITNGSLIFGADLIRELYVPLEFDTLSASSYRGTKSSGKVNLRCELKLDIVNKDILILDDIIDTGRTLEAIISFLKPYQPKRIKTCVFLQKKTPNKILLNPDYIGFTIENNYVVGYGLDYNEMYRNLPEVSILSKR